MNLLIYSITMIKSILIQIKISYINYIIYVLGELMKNKIKWIRIKLKYKIIIFLNIFIISFTIFIYKLDKIVTPVALSIANGEMTSMASEIINKAILKEYSDNFKYDEIFHIEKDNDGNIVMINADTIKMNKIACAVALNSQQELRKAGKDGVKISSGYILKNNLLANIGPKVKVRMQPIGNIETSYSSEFSAAGINQTNHKIYIIVKTKIRVIFPFKNSEVEVKNEIPIVDTIIIGKVPVTAFGLDLKGTGINLKN